LSSSGFGQLAVTEQPLAPETLGIVLIHSTAAHSAGMPESYKAHHRDGRRRRRKEDHGHLQGPFTARAAIEFDLGAEFGARVIDAVRYGRVIYAAVRSADGRE
jgi:hypothetical protein